MKKLIITNFKPISQSKINIRVKNNPELFSLWTSDMPGSPTLIVSRINDNWLELTPLNEEVINYSDYYLYREGNVLINVKM